MTTSQAVFVVTQRIREINAMITFAKEELELVTCLKATRAINNRINSLKSILNTNELILSGGVANGDVRIC